MPHAETKEKIDRLLAETIDESAVCDALCNELETAVEQLETATGAQRTRLLARLRAINAQRTTLHCLECFFQ